MKARMLFVFAICYSNIGLSARIGFDLSAIDLLERGQAQLIQGKPTEAITSLTEFVSIFPEHVYADHAHLLILKSYVQSKEVEKAKSLSEFFLEKYPQSFRRNEVEQILASLANGK